MATKVITTKKVATKVITTKKVATKVITTKRVATTKKVATRVITTKKVATGYSNETNENLDEEGEVSTVPLVTMKSMVTRS